MVKEVIVSSYFKVSLFRWLETVEQSYLQVVSGDSNISWTAYHASHQPEQELNPAITALLPLFPDESKSLTMI